MVKLIWCEDKNHGIAKDCKIPWKIPEEMQHFKDTTINNVVVMGYNTFVSIGKPLINRTNIVLSRKHRENLPSDVLVYTNFKQVLRDFKNVDIYVIGGKSVYETAIEYADELIVSRLPDSYNCDLTLKLNLSNFELQHETKNKQFSVAYYKKIQTEFNQVESNEHETQNIFNLKFDNFTGPFDLLLALIKDKKMDILNLNLAELTEQYLKFIKQNIKTVEIEQITDYLVMATYLIELKSIRIIPVESVVEDEIDLYDNKERDRLVRRLIEYKHYREIIPQLENLQIARQQMIAKEPDDWKEFQADNSDIPEAPLPEYINPIRLYDAMQRVIERAKNKHVMNQKISIEELSIEEVQDEVYEIIKSSKSKQMSLTRILNQVDRLRVSEMYFVTCFVALLVLTRYQKITLRQESVNDEIYAELKKESEVEVEESVEDMIKRQEEFKREAEEYKKQIMKQRALEHQRKREEYLKNKYGDAYVSREQYLKMTPEERQALKEKQAKINEAAKQKDKQSGDNNDEDKE